MRINGKGIDPEQAQMLIAEQLQRNDLTPEQRGFWIRSARSAGMPTYPPRDHYRRPHARKRPTVLSTIVFVAVAVGLLSLTLGAPVPPVRGLAGVTLIVWVFAGILS